VVLQEAQHTHGVRLPGSVGKRGNTRVDHVDPGLNGSIVGARSQTRGLVRVHNDGNAEAFFQTLDDFVGLHGGDEACHVFHANGITAEVGDGFPLLNELFHRVHRARGVANHPLGMLAHCFDRFDGLGNVAHVIERIKGSENIHSVLGGTADKSFHHIIGEIGVLDNVLPAKQHHVLGLRRPFLDRVQSLKGKLVEEAQARIDSCPSPGFQSSKPQTIQELEGRKHLLCPHAGCRE
jgi:hypothetical protein